MIDRFIREKETSEITGLSRQTRWRMEKAGKFPKRHKISPGITAYLASEILAWLESCSKEALQW